MLLIKILDTQPLSSPSFGLFFWTVLSIGLLALGILFLYKIYKYVTSKVK